MTSGIAPASATAPEWHPQRVQIGEWTVTALTDGFMRLDGGSMWGVVPAVMWRQMTPPADDNTILLALRPFLAERGDDKVVIEGGIGDRWERRWRDVYHIERPVTLEAALGRCGVAPGEVTHVVASHCHFDHIGALVGSAEGRLQPLFPNARHFAPRIEVEVALHPDHVRRASYRPDDVQPLVSAGLLEPFDAPFDPLPGIRCHDASGHSDGVCVVTIGEEAPGDTAVFLADVVPTAHHVQPAYIMAFDIDVARSFEHRSYWLQRMSQKGWLGLFYHDPDHAFGRITRPGKRYEVTPQADG